MTRSVHDYVYMILRFVLEIFIFCTFHYISIFIPAPCVNPISLFRYKMVQKPEKALTAKAVGREFVRQVRNDVYFSELFFDPHPD